jgi:hypothetical protein
MSSLLQRGVTGTRVAPGVMYMLLVLVLILVSMMSLLIILHSVAHLNIVHSTFYLAEIAYLNQSSVSPLSLLLPISAAPPTSSCHQITSPVLISSLPRNVTSHIIPSVTTHFHITSHDIAADSLCSNLARFACDNIDIEKQLELAQRLLEALIGNSIKKHPRQITGEVEE